MNAEPDLVLLSNIKTTLAANPGAKQREIAAGMGVSLGMTNIVLRRFAGKGWIMAKRLSARNIRYILTPEGMNELAHRSYHYMRRTFTEVRECAAAVEAHIMQAKTHDCTNVVLYGQSDIAPIIEWAAKRAGMEFEQVLQPDGKTGVPEKALGIVGECADNDAADTLTAQGCVSVYDVAEREEILPC
jgi:DNA-binding MarR family transcriptional regulator